jgi:OFA family oxalate/formate antiporter-like MFS transporter
MLVGHAIMCLSILGAAYAKSWALFVCFVSIGYPFGIGIVYWTPIMCGWEWFPKNKGLVSGLVVGGYGFAAFIFGFISTAIANPEDFKPKVPEDGSGDLDKLMPESVGESVQKMYLVCLAIWFVLGMTAVFGVFRNPEFIRREGIRERHETLNHIMAQRDETHEANHVHINFIEYWDALKS